MFANVPWRRRAGVAALSLALLGAGAAVAVAADAAVDNAPGGAAGQWHHDWEKHREDRLVKELGLNPQQTQLAEAAFAKMRPSPEMMQKMHRESEARRLALMDPNFDPRKAAAEEDQERAEREAHMKDVRNAWFALWDTLSPEQRTKARLMLLTMHEHGHGHWGGHGMEGHGMEGRGMGPGGPQGGPGMPPPPPHS